MNGQTAAGTVRATGESLLRVARDLRNRDTSRPGTVRVNGGRLRTLCWRCKVWWRRRCAT